jgi:hypothetical protein
MPAYNWFEYQATQDVNFVLRKYKKTNKRYQKALLLLWADLINEYVSLYGFSPDFKQAFQKRKEILELKVRYAETEENILLTQIEIKEQELAAIYKEKPEQMETDELKATLEQFLKFQIDMKKTSVTEFYGYIKLLSKANVRK